MKRGNLSVLHVEKWEIWLNARTVVTSITHSASIPHCGVSLVALGNVKIAEMLLLSPNVIF